MHRVLAAALALAALAASALPAQAHVGGLGHDVAARMASAQEPCPGRAIDADQIITGRFESDRQGAYVMVPFTVPDGTTAVRVKYCFDQPDSPTSSQARHTLDLGLYEPVAGEGTWGPRQLRGWGGSSHPDVTVSPEGFAPYGEQAPGRTTRAFRPGPVRDGRWAVELGLAAIVGRDLGDSDGGVQWRVEIERSEDPAFADEPYEPAPYPRKPASPDPGWYTGDLHVHGEHSALNDAPLTEVLEYAFETAGLDFFTLSDYVGGAQWDEIGRFTPAHPGKLVVRSAEVITYRGHVNNHASATTVDHRTGPVLELAPDGGLEPVRDAQPASRILQDIRAAGGVTQLNHVTIFPSAVPGFTLQCRGCPWDYTGEETDWSLVDAIEVATGPAGIQDLPGDLGPNPFTATAVDFYEDALRSGERIAAVGSSDSHNAGRRNNPVTQAPIGMASTVVLAPELSEPGIACGVRAGHTYVKVWGPDRPDLRLEATVPGAAGTATFGDTVRGEDVRFTARVLGGAPEAGQPYTLLVVKDGSVVSSHAVGGDEFAVEFTASAPGRYGLRLMRGSSIEVVATPVWVEAAGAEGPKIVSRACDAEPVARRARAARRAERRHRTRQARKHRRQVRSARRAAR